MRSVILKSKESIIVGDHIYQMDEQGEPNRDIEPIHIELAACSDDYLKSLSQMELLVFANYFSEYREVYFGGYTFNA